MTKEGKLIVLYGINNLGKTTQAALLVDRLKFNGYKAKYLKYPIYELEPSGKILNNYLRENNPYGLSAREAQIIYTLNRVQYQPQLLNYLKNGINIIAEDYVGTGLAWGIGSGISEKLLKKINNGLIKEDLAFLFDGERFLQSREKNHKHEGDNDLTNKVRWSHLKLKEEYKWVKINANNSITNIHDKLWKKVIKLLEKN
jgi:dTMP kinase